jgi:hypothetical protein
MRLPPKTFNMKLKLLFLLMPVSGMAQHSGCDSIKFEMIRETVNFLSTDKKISDNLNFKVNCSRPSYNCLEAGIEDKKLRGVLSKVRSWDAKKEENTPADVKKVKERIFTEVFGTADKAYRKKLPGYAVYASKMESLLSKSLKSATGSGKQAPTVVKKVDTTTVEADAPDDVPAESGIPDSAAGAAGFKKEEITKKEDMQSNLPYIALVAAIVAMVISFLALMKKPPRSKRSSTPPADNGSAAQKEQIRRLGEDLKDLNAKVNTSLSSFGSLSNRVLELEQKPTVFEFDVREKRDSPSIVTQEDDAAPVNTSFTRYAKFSDLVNGGFSPVMLMETQNGEQTYTINIDQDRAAYQVSDDPKAQKYALQNYEYLSGACEIRNQPQNGVKIFTVSPGTLQRSADQNWMIEKPAVIEFR